MSKRINAVMSLDDGSSAGFLAYLGTYEVLNISDKKARRNIYNKHYLIKNIIHGVILSVMLLALFLYIWLPYYEARVQADSVNIHVESLEILYPLECSIVLMDSLVKRCARGEAILRVSSNGSNRIEFRQLTLYSFTKEMRNYVTVMMLGDFHVSSPHDSELVVVPFYIFLDNTFTYEGLCTNRSKYPLTVKVDSSKVWISGVEYIIPTHAPQTLYNYTPCSRSSSRLS